MRSTAFSTTTFLACAVCAGSGTTQRLVETTSPAQLPPNPSGSIVYGDFDGDGSMDLLGLPSRLPAWRIATGDGTGLFADWRDVTSPAPMASLLRVGPSIQEHPVADFDGDGDLDVIYRRLGTVLPTPARPRIAWNDGAGAFPTEDVAPFGTREWDLVLVGDLDSDGDPDAITIGRQGSSNPDEAQVWLNDGGGVFSPGQVMPVESLARERVQLLDHDADGDLDFFADQAWDNDGAGAFSNVTLTRFPIGMPRGPSRVADFDGDGRVDMVNTLGLWLDNGSGELVFSLLLNFELALNVETFDFDADGDQDVLMCGTGDAPTRLFRNLGGGAFSGNIGPFVFPEGARNFVRCNAVDVDSDSDPDLLCIGSFGRPRLLLADGQGRYLDANPGTLPRQPEGADGAKLGDLDGDGDLDAIVRRGIQLVTYRNDGFGNYSRWRESPVLASGGAMVEFRLADFDLDGNLDAVFGQTVFRGDGAGGLTTARFSQLNGRYNAVADFDGDGDPDIAYPGLVERNDGNFVFTPITTGFPAGSAGFTSALTPFDADSDGDVDLLISTTSRPDVLMLNDGSGVLTDVTATNMPAVSRVTFGFTPVDFDGDGDLDLLGSSAPTVFGAGELFAYENVGAGVFSDATATVFGVTPVVGRNVVAADFDGDGDPDLLTDGAPRFFEGTPNGFVDASTSWVGLTPVGTEMQVVDVDSDGDPDVVTTVGTTGMRIVHNRRRQLVVRNFARTGSDLRLRAHAEATGSETVFPFVSPLAFAPGIPTPWGLLLSNAGVAITFPSGSATLGAPSEWALSLPADPALVGLELFAQALFVPSNGALWRLSNAVRFRVVE